MIMRATMLHLKASTTSKVGTKLAWRDTWWHTYCGWTYSSSCGHGVCGSTFVFCHSEMYFLFVHLSIGNHLHIYIYIYIYLSLENPLTYLKEPWSFWGGLHYSWKKHQTNSLYTTTREKGRNNLYSKRIHKWIIIIGGGGGGWVFP